MAAVCFAGTQVSAQQPPKPDIDYQVAQVSAAAGGVYAYAPETWGLLRLNLANRRDEPVEVLCATYFDSDPSLQYGRRIWLPARARLQTWHPIRLPPLSDPDQDTVEFHTLVSETGGSREVLVRDDVGKMQLSDMLPVVRHSFVTGIVSPLDVSPDTPDEPVSPFNLAMTGRLSLQLPRLISTIGDRLLPAGDEGYQALDQLVVADDRMLGDAPSLSAIRRWLFDGGRLWIMLDRVDADLLGALLGDESGCQMIDSVTLTRVRVTKGPDGGDFEEHQSEFEQPVKLVRVLVDQEEVTSLVNGWPAAFWKNYGAGRLLVTTLESRAWVRPQTEADQFQVRGAEEYTGPVPIRAFQKLMDGFFVRRPEQASVADVLEPQVQEYVGYSVPSRNLVFTLLGGFVVALGTIGTALYRTRQLEKLALAGPVLAMVVAAALMAVGRHQQSAVPPTTALLEVVRPLRGTDDVHVSGSAGLYAQNAGTLVLGGEKGGWMVPQLSGTEGTTKRLIWSDLDKWQWENVPQSPGLRTAEFHLPIQTRERISASARFGPEGLSGHLSIPDSLHAEDAVLATRHGRIGVDLHPDGEFAALTVDELGAEEYVSSGLLSDEQSRRSRALSLLLQRSSDSASEEPTLYLWSKPWELGLERAAGVREVGAALLVVPVTLQRPRPGTNVTLPSLLLPYRGAIGPDGLQPSGLYDHRRNLWTQKTWPSETWLRFQFPRVLLPMEVMSVEIVVRVTGPVGKLVLSIDRDGDVVPVETWMDPVGTLSLVLEGSDVPSMDADGGLWLRVAGGDPDRPELTNPDPDGTEKVSYWKIESMEMDARAMVLEQGD